MIPWYGWVVIVCGALLPVVSAAVSPFIDVRDKDEQP